MPDLLIRGARLVPVQPGDVAPDHAVDVLVRDGRVAEVSTGLSPGPTSAVEEVDAEGRWLLPGLWDQHVHLGQWTLARQRMDLADVTSADDLLARVAEQVARAPGRPVVGWGHRPGGWPHAGGVAALDAVTGATPAVLIAGDGHHAWLNSAALAALGLPPRDPASGDETVRENEWFAAYSRLTDLPGGDGDGGTSPAAYRESLLDAAALGVVGVVDFEFVGSVDDWAERWGSGCDVLRVRAATYADGLDDVVARGLRTGDPLAGDDRLTMGPLKIISDGSLNTRTAWCCEPYADGDRLDRPRGGPNLGDEDLRHLLGRAHAAGLEVATHAIGDAAVGAALDAYGATGARGSVEHAQLIDPRDAARLAELGLRASVQPAHLLDDRDLTEQVWPGRADRSFAFRWLLDSGAPLAFGSDAPVSPLDPWLALAAAVHRTADERPAWGAEQAVTPREALAASVDGQPMVGPGGRGDLALVDDDPLDVRSAWARGGRGGRSPRAALTVVAGRVVHRDL